MSPLLDPCPSHPPCVFQVIILQPQVQAQPESSAEPRPPTEEPPQGAQATKEDQPPSQENPEVVWPAGGSYTFLALRPGSLQGWDNFIRKLLTGCSELLTGCSCQSRAHPVSCVCTLCSLGCARRVRLWSAGILPPSCLAECQQCLVIRRHTGAVRPGLLEDSELSCWIRDVIHLPCWL